MRSFRRRLPVSAGLVVLLLAAAPACGDDGSPGTPAASEPSPVTSPDRSTTTEALTPEEEVEAAYLRSWDVYAKAVRELDPSGLEESYVDVALETVTQEVERLRRANTPVRVEVEHDYSIQLTEHGGIVTDRYVNHSVYVDPETGEPTESDPNRTVLETYQLQQRQGKWRVVTFVRQSS